MGRTGAPKTIFFSYSHRQTSCGRGGQQQACIIEESISSRPMIIVAPTFLPTEPINFLELCANLLSITLAHGQLEKYMAKQQVVWECFCKRGSPTGTQELSVADRKNL
jgi:hypothetical protein